MGRTELARALGVSRQTLTNYQKAGVLPPPRRINGERVEFEIESQMIAAELVAGNAA